MQFEKAEAESKITLNFDGQVRKHEEAAIWLFMSKTGNAMSKTGTHRRYRYLSVGAVKTHGSLPKRTGCHFRPADLQKVGPDDTDLHPQD